MRNLVSFVQLKNFSKYLDSDYWILAYEETSQNNLYIRPMFMSRGQLYYNSIGQGWIDDISCHSQTIRFFSDEDLLNKTSHSYLMTIKIYQPIEVFTTEEILDIISDVTYIGVDE